MDFATLLQILDATLRLMTPLLLACLAGLFSERAGIFDIGLEGKMLMAAFCAGAVAAVTLNPWLGLLAGIFGSLVLSLIHGLASITFRGNQLISGVAINFLASGMTLLLSLAIFGMGGNTPPLSGGGRFPRLTLPFADSIGQVPLIGPFYAQALSGHTALTYIALACVPLTWWLLYRTRFGLRLRAVGENPEAVDTVGVSVTRLRYAAVLICGILCGIAGAHLATGIAAGFFKEMTAGRGYIALAALIFAKWRPWWALFATFLFALLQAVADRYPNLDLGPVTIPDTAMQAAPYILTVIILAGFVGRANPPKAGGEPYVKER
ncbi:MAG: ABC transporter permease [Paracoccus sp. (in: a-proteobacteria)]|uniref:ABC transporter permease n=1 Tax=Paracoccus sp. TaxID=267 RepID=UPI0026DEB81C|nr:ABC transporter permease [Paracoccus sp. (in: a-proteobacteria)]MDO5620456.1 ABC transporter permease [Paracoccus sp. (in: a-proteobacteria)]